jgi:hypothetical protein
MPTLDSGNLEEKGVTTLFKKHISSILIIIMRRVTLLLLVLVASIATDPIPLEGSDSGPIVSNHTGWIHDGSVVFRDQEHVISKGPITLVEVCHAGYIHGIQLHYGEPKSK